MKRIGHSGTFDVSSFGDLLYTAITRAELAPFDMEIVTAAPTGVEPFEIPDATPPLAISRVVDVAGWIAGGGNLLAPSASGVYGERTLSAYEEILMRSRPCIWQSLGVMNERNALSAHLVEAMQVLSYFSVRDEYALNYVRRYTQQEVFVIPDIAFGLPRIWDKQQIAHFLPKVIRAGGSHPYCTVSCRRRDAPDRVAVAKSIVTCVRRHDVETVVLLAASPCHGDHLLADSLASEIRLQARDLRCFTTPKSSMRASVALLAHAVFHIGNSYHGGVVSDAYRVPVLWVSDIDARGNNKIRGALRWSSACLSSQWADIADQPICWSMREQSAHDQKKIIRDALLQKHWVRVRNEILKWSAMSDGGAGR